MSRKPKPLIHRQTIHIAGGYALFSALWIFFSDRCLALFVSDIETLTHLQTYKGWTFVAMTTLLVGLMVQRQLNSIYTTKRALVRSEERYRNMVEGSDDLICVIDVTGRFTFVNRRAGYYLGVSAEEARGKNGFDFVHPDDRERSQLWFAEAVRQKQASGSIENRLVTADGRETPMLWTANFTYTPDGTLAETSAIARDISDRYKAEEMLRETLRMKSWFISTAAHELRTPLASILGFCELLSEEINDRTVADAHDREYLDIIMSRAEILIRITNDLLDLGRLETGTPLPLACSELDLRDLIHDAAVDARVRVPSRTILETTGESAPVPASVDPVRIRQLLDNLLDNAVKYSPADEPVGIALEQDESKIRISVSDQGVGLNADQVDRIFERFYRVNARDSDVSGLGLGLSISREIALAHGGKLTVSSTPGKGSTFTLSLPR